MLKIKRKEVNEMKFTRLDFANCIKYSEVANNATMKIAFDSLTMERPKANQLLIIQQIIGYLRCMCDMKIISHNVFNDCIADLHYMRDELKKGE